ncbi:MAG: hypothetical protein ABMA64_11730, partial [Myxococcota bacterium]
MTPDAGPLVTPSQLREAARDAVVRLDPRYLVRNPVMFTVGVATAVTGVLTLRAAATGDDVGYPLAVTSLLLLTVWFANFSDAIAEARGRAQAASLRGTRTETQARRRRADGTEERVASADLQASLKSIAGNAGVNLLGIRGLP